MENIPEGMKEKPYRPEKLRHNRSAKIVEEDGFIIEVDTNAEASKRGGVNFSIFL